MFVAALARSIPSSYDAAMFSRLAATGCLVFIFLGGKQLSAAAAEPAKPAAGFRVVGYLPDYRIAGIDPAVGKLVTDVIYFSLPLTADGGLERTAFTDGESRLLRAIREHGARVHVSLGGGDRSQHFASVAADREKRSRLIEAVVEFIDRFELSGVDVDWEFPQNEQQYADFAMLLKELKAALVPKNRELSIAVAGWQELPQSAIDAVDLVHLMAYDGAGRHSTYDYAVTEIERVLKRGVPANKLCLGLPFYGRQIEHRERALSYAEIARRFQPAADTDEAAGYYFNGPRTLERKAQFAREKGLAGIMIWELGQDDNQHTLLQSVSTAATHSRQ